MNTFSINDYHIDVSRCQIRHNDHTVSLEPKVMQVLVLLAQHQGDVVSHHQLLDEIWTNTVVEPSALQRCIGQLRKAFGDTAKDQNFIATYPKKGYSLVPPVNWVSTYSVTDSPLKLSRPVWPAFAALALLIFVAASFYVLPMKPTSSTSTVEASVQTSKAELPQEQDYYTTDFFAVYSQDGQHVVYPRFAQGKLSHLWAKNIIEEEEYLLTPQAGYYQNSSWAPDNGMIAYTEVMTEDMCDSATCDGSLCFSLKTIQMPTSQAVEARDIEPDVLMNCRQAALLSPQWLSSSTLSVIETSNERSTIIGYDSKNGSRSVLYHHADTTPYYQTYSHKAGLLALAMRTNTHEFQLVVLSPETGELKTLYTSDTESSLGKRYPTWNQEADGLVISDNNGIITVDLNGQVSKQSFPYLPSHPVAF